MTSPEIIFTGAIVADLVAATVPRDLPPGETIFIDHVELAVGGNAAIAAISASRLGAAVHVAGLVGDDTLGEILLSRLQTDGIDTSLVQVWEGEKTSTTMALARHGGERSLLHCSGANSRSIADRLLPAILRYDSPAVFSLSGAEIMQAMRDGEALELVRSAKSKGLTTAFDTTYPPRVLDYGTFVAELAPHIDFFFTSMGEATLFSESTDLLATAQFLQAAGASTVIIKDGSRGALALDSAGQAIYCTTPQVDAIDTTGAGDNFVGAFLAQYAGTGSLAAALKLAVSAGALSVQHLGGQAQYTAEQARDLSDALTIETISV